MAATHIGLPGLSVAGHAMEERNIVIVHVTIPDHHTVAKAAGAWEKLSIHKNVTNLDAQVKIIQTHEPNEWLTFRSTPIISYGSYNFIVLFENLYS